MRNPLLHGDICGAVDMFRGDDGVVVVLIHTCKRELSPARLACP
jgi:hypothetical protein